MSINVAGATTGTGQEVETAGRAARVTLRPVDVVTGATGTFRKAMNTGLIAAGFTAGTPIFAFRWAPTPNTAICLVRRITLSAGNGATAFAAGLANFGAFVARSFSASDTGGTTGTFTTNNAKLRTSYATSLGATCIIAGTGANTAGTRTLDTDPFAIVETGVVATAGTTFLPSTDLFRPQPGEGPLVLANNEGVVIQATVPATGVWTAAVAIEWDELLTYTS